MGDERRIAMWSGPRNISTAMMRSWENREDCYVCDEPLYASYLKRTGLDHPAREQILQAQDNDWRNVAAWLTGPIPEGRTIFYQKHMAHHLLPEIERDWLDALTHVFLIREPRAMISSYLVRRPEMTLEDSGLPQQWEIFERVRAAGDRIPPVLDTRDVLEDPRGMLGALCARLGVEFSDRMLHWPAGRRATDGVWAEHWYDAVEASTGFQRYSPKNVTIPPEYETLAKTCEDFYRRLHEHRLRPLSP